MIFYIGLNPRWQQYGWLPQGINVMYSAAGFWNGREWRRKRFIKQAGQRWLDPGGFTLLNSYGDYPFSIVNFFNLVAFLRPHYYATLDYPCEPEISRNLGLMSNEERIKATVENAIRMQEYETHVEATMVTVIQGYTLGEYLHCIDLHHRAGTIRSYMAVGSMCRRLSNTELHRLIPGIYEHAKQAGCERLHFFGLKLSPALRDLNEFIYSRDSAVILDAYDTSLPHVQAGRRWPKGQIEIRQTIEAFLRRVEGLGLQCVT